MSVLKNSPEYQAYLALEHRPADMPCWRKDEHGQIRILNGEVFCRVGEDGMIECPVGHKFSGASALRKHVTQSHRLQVLKEDNGPGDLAEVMASIKYFGQLMGTAHTDSPFAGGNSTGQSNLAAPSKKNKEKPKTPLPIKKNGEPHKGRIRALLRVPKNETSCISCHEKLFTCFTRVDTCEYLQQFDCSKFEPGSNKNQSSPKHTTAEAKKGGKGGKAAIKSSSFIAINNNSEEGEENLGLEEVEEGADERGDGGDKGEDGGEE